MIGFIVNSLEISFEYIYIATKVEAIFCYIDLLPVKIDFPIATCE